MAAMPSEYRKELEEQKLQARNQYEKAKQQSQ